MFGRSKSRRSTMAQSTAQTPPPSSETSISIRKSGFKLLGSKKFDLKAVNRFEHAKRKITLHNGQIGECDVFTRNCHLKLTTDFESSVEYRFVKSITYKFKMLLALSWPSNWARIKVMAPGSGTGPSWSRIRSTFGSTRKMPTIASRPSEFSVCDVYWMPRLKRRAGSACERTRLSLFRVNSTETSQLVILAASHWVRLTS